MNQIAILPPDQVQLPAYALGPATAAQIALRGTLDETGGVSVRRITPENGRFHFEIGDTPFADPGPLNIVVVAFAPRMGRTYYQGAFVKGESGRRPDCWSADGITPDADVPALTKQSATCAACPQSKKGSKIADGREMTACALSQKIVVSPPDKVGNPDSIYLMQINATSVLSQNVPLPYLSYRDYLGWFRQRNASGANVLPQHALTEISFVVQNDAPNHMQFRIANWAPEALARKIEEFATHPTVQLYLHGPNGPKNSAIPLAAPASVAQPTQPALPTQPAPAPVSAATQAVQTAPAGFGAFAAPAPQQAPAPVAPPPVVQPAATNAPPPGRRGRGRPAADAAPAPVAPAAGQSAFGGSGFGAPLPSESSTPAQGGFSAPASAFGAAAAFGGFADPA